MVELNWNAGIEVKQENDVDTVRIAGMLIDTSVCLNNFAVAPTEFEAIAKQGTGTTLRVDHSKAVRDIVGGVTAGRYDVDKKQVLIEAEIDDPYIQKLAKKGRVKFFSIGASADANCSDCGQEIKGNVRSCKCKKAHAIIKNVKLKEVSIVTDPAFTAAEFKPFEACASFTVTPDSLKEEGGTQNINVIGEQKMSETQKTDVKATSTVSAGPDSVILLAEMSTKFEQLKKELDALKAEKKAEADEKSKKDEDEKVKKEEAVVSKLEAVLSKLEKKLEEKDVEKEEKKEADEDEEDEEEKKEAKASKGAKVESAENTVEASVDGKPTWFAEIADFAKKHGILD